MYNLHNHTFRCGHATGQDEDYVLEAIKNGYTVMGFSDHAPYAFPNGHKSGYRISLDDTQNYVSSVRALQEKYKSIIDIKLGFELEYFPDLFDKEIEYLKSFKYDYLILGQHYTDNEYEPYAKYSGTATDSVAVLDKYISQVIMGAKTGLFTYIAHPDLINFTGDRQVYINKMTYFIERLKQLDIPLEFNFLGFTTKRNYPNRDFWGIVAKAGNRVLIGLDAHNPNVYSDKENLEKAKEYLNSFGITPMELKDLRLVNREGRYEQF
ncbi:histidinol-phosphatase [uncultured Eubacterium sp.]|uniref:histidinol-phosphatase n=1 Tax=uncultured Eubacterium sp. TaxID=165185 RepID=UPI0015B94186|nr:PHP domain-containing protein [uncultured Eubacterium sp.]